MFGWVRVRAPGPQALCGFSLLLLLAACAPELSGTGAYDPTGGGDDPVEGELDSGGGSKFDASFGIGGDDPEEGDCEDAAPGEEQQRIAYALASVVSPDVCTSEVQTRTCEDGSWSAWQGSFRYAECVVVYRGCGGVAHGESESRVRYPTAIVENHEDCVPESQTRTCNDGTFSEWSGSAQETHCEVALYGICGAGATCHEGQCANSHTMLFTSQCLSAVGEACAQDDECVNTCVQGSCAPESGAGEACDGKGDCGFLACLSAPGGATCTDELCQCPSGNFCTSNDQCVGTCARSSCRPINTVCDVGDAEDCTGAFTCVDRRCVLPEGSACTSNSECRDACRSQVCGPRGTFEEACDETADCATGLACSPSAGTCLLPIGATCSTPSSCASNKCGCSGTDCTKRCRS
jgi:hypothetical protein